MAARNTTQAEEPVAAVVDEDTGEIQEGHAVSLIAEAFKSDGVYRFTANDPETVQAAIVQRMMAAESLDDLFGQWEAKTIDKFEGEVVTISEAEWGTFNSEQGQIPLARLKLTVKDGKVAQDVIATSPNLTAFIYRAQSLDLLPFTAKIVGAKTARGFTALHFERV
jgi:hypothetical protein